MQPPGEQCHFQVSLESKAAPAVCMKYHGQLAAADVLGYQRVTPGKQPGD